MCSAYAYSGLRVSTASHPGEGGFGFPGSTPPFGKADEGCDDGTGTVSAMRTADTTPDAKVSAAITHIAAPEPTFPIRSGACVRCDPRGPP